MLGMLELNDGTINFRLDNQERTLEKDISHKEWLHQIAYLSQQPYFFSGSVRENMTFNAQDGAFNIEEFENLVDRIGLRDCLGSRPLDFELNEGATNLSGGQQQRLAFIRAIRRDQPVLIMDEATSALDHKNRELVFDLLRQRAEKGVNVLLITHDREIAERCDTRLDMRTR